MKGHSKQLVFKGFNCFLPAIIKLSAIVAFVTVSGPERFRAELSHFETGARKMRYFFAAVLDCVGELWIVGLWAF